MYLNADRNGPGPFEIRTHACADGVLSRFFGADDIVPEIGSGDKCPAPVLADSRCVDEGFLRLPERLDQSKDFRREAVDGCERVLEPAEAY